MKRDPNHLEPAASIISRLGGVSAVAAVIGVAPQTVLRWRLAGPERPGDKAKGTGGSIPQRHIPALMAHARATGVALSLDDFFTPMTEGQAA